MYYQQIYCFIFPQTALETQVINKEYEGWIWFNAVKLYVFQIL